MQVIPAALLAPTVAPMLISAPAAHAQIDAAQSELRPETLGR